MELRGAVIAGRARRVAIPAAIALACVGLMAACATTQQTGAAQPSGFLGDYSQLQSGRGDQAQLLYIHLDADFSRYSKVLIDPVTVWRAGDSRLAELPEDEAQRLADYFAAALRREIAREFELATSPGPGVLRIRAAITEVSGSNVALDIASTVLPPVRAISAIKRLATGTHAFVGRASIEIEILDAESGERLVAAVDERAGGKALRGATSTWSDVEDAYDHWAEVIATRLSLFRRIDAQDAE